MIPDLKFDYYTGVQRFASARELKLYLKKQLETYERALDLARALTGDLMREGEGPAAGQSKGWFKVGNLFANKTDPNRAGLDILFQMLNDARPKLANLQDSLKAFDRFAEFSIPEDVTLMLYLRDGVPERIVIGSEMPSPKDTQPSGTAGSQDAQPGRTPGPQDT